MTDYTNVPIAASGDWIDDAYLNTYLGDNFRAVFGPLTAVGQLLVSLTANRLSKVAVTGNAGYVLTEDPAQPEKMKFAAPSAGLTLQQVYPIGCIYTSTVATNPNTVFGFGTWSQFGQGRVLVGQDSGQTEFDVVEETGGAKTHTLTSNEMPAHTHVQNAHSHTIDVVPQSFRDGTSSNDVRAMGGSGNTGSTTATNQNTGGGLAHNNLQPYVVVYFWKRTA